MPLLGISGSDVKIAGWNSLMSFAQFGACTAVALVASKISQYFINKKDPNAQTARNTLSAYFAYQATSNLISSRLKLLPVENISANRKLLGIQLLLPTALFLLGGKGIGKMVFTCVGASYFGDRGVQVIQALGTITGAIYGFTPTTFSK